MALPTGGTITTNGTKTVHTFNSSATFTPNVSGTAGAMTATRPTTASTIVRVVGYAGVDADTVYFNPSGTWIETAAA